MGLGKFYLFIAPGDMTAIRPDNLGACRDRKRQYIANECPPFQSLDGSASVGLLGWTIREPIEKCLDERWADHIGRDCTKGIDAFGQFEFTSPSVPCCRCGTSDWS